MFIDNEHSVSLKVRTLNFSPALFPQTPQTPLPLLFKLNLQMKSLKDCLCKNWDRTWRLDGTIADPVLYGEYFT